MIQWYPGHMRKAVRLMDMADQFNLPVLTFVDTAGAYPGVGAEERGQAEAIARSTERCLTLGVPIVATITGEGVRYRFNHALDAYEPDPDPSPFQGIIAGARADEEGSRSKERYFSPRDVRNEWDIGDQPPEFWNQFKTDFPPGVHIRIHPLLDWTELNIWEYIEREEIPTVSLYYNHGDGKRYRSLGCYPCTTPVESEA